MSNKQVKSTLRRNGLELKNFSKHVRKNEEYVAMAIQQNYKAAEFIDAKLKKDDEFVKKMCDIHPGVLLYVDEKYLYDEDIVYKALPRTNSLEFLPKEHCSNYLSAKIAVQSVASNYDYLSLEMKKDPRILDIAFSCDGGRTIKYLPEECYDDESIMLRAIEIYGDNMEHLPSKYLYNEEFIMKAVPMSPSAFQYIPDRFKLNPFFVERLIKKNGNIIEFVEDLNEELILMALENDPMALKFVPKKFLSNEKIVKFALIKNHHAIEVIPPHYMNDQKLALEIVEENPNVYIHFSNSIKINKEIILKAATKNRDILRMVPKFMEYDMEIIWLKKRYYKRIRDIPYMEIKFLFL